MALTFGKSEKAWDERRPEGNETNHSEYKSIVRAFLLCLLNSPSPSYRSSNRALSAFQTSSDLKHGKIYQALIIKATTYYENLRIQINLQ